MTRRVYCHIGLPKTGTSFLQAILWKHRAELGRSGLLLPGRAKRDHLLASLIVRDDPGVHRRGQGAERAWEVVVEQTRAWGGDALISHEFFCAASRDQAVRLRDDLAPAELHLVLTAREPLGLFTSSWQEALKNKATVPMADYSPHESDDPRDVWNWRALDLGLVLERWGEVVPPERVHVIVASDTGGSRAALWHRFAGVVGAPESVADVGEAFPNASMGVVEAETLRRVNQVLTGFDSAYDRGRWIRSFLADQRLVPRGGERFWPGAEQVADCRARGERAVALLQSRGYDVVGDAEALRVPADLPARRTPETVTDAEVAGVAVELVATLLDDVRRRSRPRRPAPGRGVSRPVRSARPGGPRQARRGGRLRSTLRRLRVLVSRVVPGRP